MEINFHCVVWKIAGTNLNQIRAEETTTLEFYLNHSESQENDSYACFQYMCYPYTGKDKKHPLRLCKKSSDCTKLSSKEGGDGADGECVRHHNRRQVTKGICVKSRYLEFCFEEK